MNFFTNKTIGQKLTASFAILAFITLVLGGIGYYGAVSSDNSIYEIGVVRLPSVESLMKMNQSLTAINAGEEALQNPLLSSDERASVIKNIESEWIKLEAAWAIYEPLPQTEEEAKSWDEFLITFDNWKEDHLQFMALVDQLMMQTNDEEISSELLTQIRDQFMNNNKISKEANVREINDLVAINSQLAKTEVDKAVAENSVLATASMIALFLGVGVAVLLGFFMTRSINSSLGEIILSLAGGSSQVDSASRQLSESSQSMAEGASEQAASLQETSSSLEQMSAQTKQSAQNAAQAEKAMKNAQPLVDEGVEAMVRMNKTMEDIKTASMETSKIIKTIDDIAFQTNLLALNAAVEAARAGEAGKGFAVVAEEVRNLAHKSAQAAKNTSELIEKSQERSDRGLSVAQEVAENLSKISKSVNDVSTLVVEISAASGEQATGIQQINTAMSEMDKTVQNNASNSEESASAAEELSSQAAELRQMIDQLVLLVGDSAQKSVGKKQKKKQPRTIERSRTTYNDFQNGGFDRPPVEKQELKAPKKMDARELIPLDDSDLNGF
ncbi:HAMP domain-containing methyl-accepting chemotaxis protein [Rhodohalobacter sp. 8-1]|uniref:HAMP domain-containing methyl-accepting chemotaxis protein n=1 Tax=Rhodohalobacter sp. 8-1 TaxID=3131972 RepID=UPI0030ECC8A1